MRYGYARVSTAEQETDMQLRALERDGCQKIFKETRSGGSMQKRPMLAALLDQVRAGDAMVVYKLDRVARSLKDLLFILERLEARQVAFVSLTETIDTSTAAGRMMMQMVGAFAEFELAMIRERTTAGMRAAMARGVVVGRPRGLPPIMEAAAIAAARSGEQSISQVARDYGVHVSSIKRALARV